MKASCICPTYGRCPNKQYLLEEAIESFLRQDHKDKELIVLNDCPRQELICNAPDVVIVNYPERFTSLGEKHNKMVSLTSGDVVFPWDDDDISLPHRISQGIKHIGKADYWNPHRLYYWETGKPPVDDHGGVCHNASCYLRSAWVRANGYPHVSGAQDARFDVALRRLKVAPQLKGEKPAYIYRWGVSDRHLSGYHDHEKAYRDIGELLMPQGRFVLKPHWRIDYTKST